MAVADRNHKGAALVSGGDEVYVAPDSTSAFTASG